METESQDRKPIVGGDFITWGCNAIYRDFTVDNLVSVDYNMQQEIYESNYAMKINVGFLIGKFYHQSLTHHHLNLIMIVDGTKLKDMVEVTVVWFKVKMKTW